MTKAIRRGDDAGKASVTSDIDETTDRPWWETRWFVAAMILLAFVPLLYPPVPPLVDLLGHMGRYRVQLDLATSPYLDQFYAFRWAPIGNLGVDLFTELLARIVGLEPAVKLIVLSIPPLTVAGLLWVAHEVHHRLPPTALFALPFSYSYPFLFGFTNFALAMAMALIAFGLWLRLASRGRDRLRAILFVPISTLIFFTHAFGWGTLGLLCFSADAVRQHDRGIGWFKAGWKAALHASVMLLPVAFMLLWRRGTSQQMTFGWFQWERKWEWVYSALRDRVEWFDIGTLVVLGVVILLAIGHRRLTLSRNLAFSAIVLIAAFVMLPWTIFGSAYADMRIIPYIMAIALIAIRFKGDTYLPLARGLAMAGLLLFFVRIAGTTASLAIAADAQKVRLRALEHVPPGSRLVHLVGIGCNDQWELPRNSHLGAMAIVRRHAFSNDQWAIEGANLLSVKFREARHFAADPSQIVRAPDCAGLRNWTANQALKKLPPDVFDYAWLIDVPTPDPALTKDWQLVWRGPGSLLYRLPRHQEAQ